MWLASDIKTPFILIKWSPSYFTASVYAGPSGIFTASCLLVFVLSNQILALHYCEVMWSALIVSRDQYQAYWMVSRSAHPAASHVIFIFCSTAKYENNMGSSWSVVLQNMEVTQEIPCVQIWCLFIYREHTHLFHLNCSGVYLCLAGESIMPLSTTQQGQVNQVHTSSILT